MRIGFLHPGKMGSAMAAIVDGAALWCPAGRSPDTAARAAEAGMTDIGTVGELVSTSDVIVSICPPDAATDVATQVADVGFDGIYCDANAISPDRTRAIAAKFDRFVDGGVVGLPPTVPGRTRLYLSGADADAIAALWAGSHLEPIVIGDQAGAASALKMGFAAWTKGSGALLLAIHAMASAEGVHEALTAEWVRSMPMVAQRTEGIVNGSPPKAWRFAGEMHEIAATLESAGVPGDFHLGAAEIYSRLAGFKDATTAPDLHEIIAAILPD